MTPARGPNFTVSQNPLSLVSRAHGKMIDPRGFYF